MSERGDAAGEAGSTSVSDGSGPSAWSWEGEIVESGADTRRCKYMSDESPFGGRRNWGS